MKSLRILSIILGLGLVMNLTLQVVSQQELQCDDDEDLPDPPECLDDDDPHHAKYFPVPYDCKKYFECSNGVAHCFRCPVGTIWNQTITTCDHEAWTECVIVTTTTPTPPTEPTEPTEPPTTTTPTTTTPTTTTPTTTTPTTTTPTTTTPTTTTPTTTTPTTTTPTTTTPTTTTPTTTTPTTTTPTTTELPTDPPRTTPTSSTTERPWNLCPIDDPMPPPGECPEWEDMPTYFPYPYDCQKYFQCSNGVAICHRCANGTVWDQTQTVCAREADVGCVIVTTTINPAPVEENSIIHFFKKFF